MSTRVCGWRKTIVTADNAHRDWPRLPVSTHAPTDSQPSKPSSIDQVAMCLLKQEQQKKQVQITQNAAWLALGLASPFIIYRILYRVYRSYFYAWDHMRTRSHINVHHLHFGLIIVLVIALSGISWRQSAVVAFVLGLGLGMILDELCASTMLQPQPGLSMKEQQWYSYEASELPTGFVLLALLLTMLGLSLYPVTSST